MIAIDQHGCIYRLKGKHTRKELLDLFGARKAQKMYVGEGIHIGYVIKGLWLSVYKLENPFQQ